MNANEVHDLYRISKYCERTLLPVYDKIVKTKFPELLRDPKEIFRDHYIQEVKELGGTDADVKEKDIELFWDLTDSRDKIDYRVPNKNAVYNVMKKLPDDSFEKAVLDKLWDIMLFQSSYEHWLESIKNSNGHPEWYTRLIDSNVLMFDNESVLITDPGYIMRNGDTLDLSTIDEFKEKGLKRIAIHDTIYGDWSCTTINTDTNEKLGTFTADGGEVGIFALDEVLAYNPDYAEDLKKYPWCATVIPNFTGKAKIETKFHEEDWDIVVEVVGGGNIDFRGFQTGL